MLHLTLANRKKFWSSKKPYTEEENKKKLKNKKRKKKEKYIDINQRRFIIETTIHYNAL